MKIAAVIINFFIPGIGSLIIGKTTEGIIQLLLYFFGLFLTITVLGAIIGAPMMLAAWIWGLVTAATYNEEPSVTHVHHTYDTGAPGTPAQPAQP
ncbi:MAG: hypothetical protein AAFR64_11895, partial [Pseudomonadota bacterium]